MRRGDLVRIKKLKYSRALAKGQVDIGVVGVIVKELGELSGDLWFSVLIDDTENPLLEAELEVVVEAG